MTKDTNKENVLKVIRYIQDNVEGLKELSFGCKVKVNNRSGILLRIIKENKAPYFYEVRMDNDEYGVFSGGVKDLSEIEIIGHEPTLESLLLAIDFMGKCSDIFAKGYVGFTVWDENAESVEFNSPYDLTKTVEENLESNPELCLYLLDLFQLTTNN